MKLSSWPLSCNLYEGEIAAGPVPILFASEPEEALEAITSDPAHAHYDVTKINKALLAFEFITAKAALAVLKKPR